MCSTSVIFVVWVDIVGLFDAVQTLAQVYQVVNWLRLLIFLL
jgi:hypothetical protein